MSQRDELKDMLFEQLADLEIFERLLRFDPARQKLFLCVATLSSRGKPLASQLEQTYTGRYKPEPTTVDITAAQAQTTSSTTAPVTASTSAAATTAANTTKTASKLAKLAKAKLALNCKSHNHATNSSSATPDTSVSASTTLNTSPSTSTSHTNCSSDSSNALKDADYIQLADAPINDFPFGLDVIDFGLRLGSFLSEAGWMSESIEILKCVASRLKRMTLDKKLKIIYLDCLQR